MTFSRRFLEGVWLALLVSVVYFALGERVPPVRDPVVTIIDQIVPFVPWTFWFYMPGYIACFLLVVYTLRTRAAFRAAWRSFLLLTLLAAPFFLLYPVAGPRPAPPVGDGLTAAGIRALYGSDPVGNTFPSLHIANSALCAWLVWQYDKRVGVVTGLLAAGVMVSVLTLKQHWFVDIPGGLFLAGMGGVAYRRQLVILRERWANDYAGARPLAVELPRLDEVIARFQGRRGG